MSCNTNYDKISYLKKDAKILLKRIHSCESGAVQRFCKCCHPDFLPFSTAQLALKVEKIKLHHVHWMIAHELGYVSWAKLKSDLEKLKAHEILVLNFIRNSLVYGTVPNKSEYSKAISILNSGSYSLSTNRLVSLITGNAEPILSHLIKNPNWARQKVGPKVWSPLLYISNSIFIYPEYSENKFLNSNHKKIVKSLIEAGADANECFYLDDFKNTPITVADGFALAGRSDLLELLSGENEEMVYRRRAMHDIVGQAEDPFSDGADFGSRTNRILSETKFYKNSYALITAIVSGDLDKIGELLGKGADPNYVCPVLKHSEHGVQYSQSTYRADSPLCIALDNGRNDEILNILISHGADPFRTDDLGLSPVRIAMRYGRLNFLSDLRKKTGTIPEGISKLDEFWCAVFIGEKEEAITIFNECKLKPEKMDLHASQLFSKAAYFGNKPAIEVLLELGFSQYQSDDKGMTPLHWAVWRADIKMVKTLLNYKPPLEKTNNYQATPLDIAIYANQNKRSEKEKYSEIIQMLMEAGCTLDEDKKAFFIEVEKMRSRNPEEFADFFWMEGFVNLDSKLG